MSDYKERIQKLQEEIRKTPYHKGTEHYVGKLRARIAQLEDLMLMGRKGGGGGGRFAIKKSGDATVILIGPPSVGKSTLLNKLTNASSKVAPYAFTTTTVIPGMMNYQGAYIQILDLPGIIEDASRGRGHGREIISASRGADLLLIMADVEKIDLLKSITNELTEAGLRINKFPPKVIIKKKESGGLMVRLPSFARHLNVKIVSAIASEFRLVNAEIIIKEDLTIERLIDAFSQSRVYTKAIYVVNKIDLNTRLVLDKENQFMPLIGISAEKNRGLENLKSLIWENLDLIRIYLKKPDKEADLENPIILTKGATVARLAEKISSEMAWETNGALVWGPKVAYAGQKVGMTYPLNDKQIVTLI